MTETYLPPGVRGRRPLADRPPGRPPRARPGSGDVGAARPIGPAATSHGRTSGTSWSAAARSRPRPCCSAPGCAARIGRTLAVHPTVKLAARFDEAAQRRPTTWRCTRSRSSLPTCRSADRRRAGTGGAGPERRLGRCSVRRSRSGATWPCTTPRSRARAAARVLAVPGLRDPLVTYRLTRRDRAVARAGPGPAGAGDARSPGRRPCTRRTAAPRSSPRVGIWRRCRARSRVGEGERDDRSPVLDRAVGWSPLALGHRQLRPRQRHQERLRQRRVAAPRRPRRQPAGVGHGGRDPQRPPVPRTAPDRRPKGTHRTSRS